MSTINVVVTPVEILPHENADKLECAQIGGEGGFVCVVGKGQFTDGELAIYLPPDSVLTEAIMDSLAQNKISMKSNRLRAIKIRSVISEGLCLKPSEWLPPELIFPDSDVTEYLGITKYEPKVHQGNLFKAAKGCNPWYVNENFKKFTDIERFQKNPKMFRDTEEVLATVKYHGTNFRCGWVTVPDSELSWWDKLKRWWTKKTPKEFLVGSHNTIRKPSKNKDFNPDDDLYWKVANKYGLKEKMRTLFLDQDVILYGEIIGPSVQKGYDYGLEEHELRVFDIMYAGSWQPWNVVRITAGQLGVPTVDEVYTGPWELSVRDLAQEVDEYNGKKYTREGIVVKDPAERRNNPYHSRTIAKIINPDYLLDKTNSENH